MLWLLILVSWFFSFCVISNVGYKTTPLQAARVPLLVGGSILHQRGRQMLSSLLTQGLLTHFTLPLFYIWPCLPWPSSMSGGTHCRVHYLPASPGIDVVPSALQMCSFQGLQPHHITQGLHPSSVDTPVDIHGRSCNFLFFHPREALLVGHQVIALPFSSCGILFLLPLAEVVLHGLGLVHLSHVCWLPIHKKKFVLVEYLWPSVLVCHFVRGMSVATYPWSSSFP